jgi:SH3-like domain-containing protein
LREPAAVVLEKEVYAHYGPSERETKAFLLREGVEVKLLDESKGWLYVSLGEKNPGWVPKASCEVV